MAELVIVGVLTKLLRTKVLDNEELHNLIIENIFNLKNQVKNFDYETFIAEFKKNESKAS